MAYIHYDQKPNGAIYASLYESYREDGKVKTRCLGTLGRVIDKEKGIFRSHNKYFQYTIENGRTEAPEAFRDDPEVLESGKQSLDFGDTWFLWEYIHTLPFYPGLIGLLPEDQDSFLALLFCRVLSSQQEECSPRVWYGGNYACLLFPKADLSDGNIGKILENLGSEKTQRQFFDSYLSSFHTKKKPVGIVIDRMGVPTAADRTIIRVDRHDGSKDLEVRMIYAADQVTGMPVCFRCFSGRYAGTGPLTDVIDELSQAGIPCEYVILEPGYLSEKNACELLENEVPFLTRLEPDSPLFQEAARDHLDGLLSQKYAYRCGDGLVYIRKVPLEWHGKKVFVYLCIDEDTYLTRHKQTILTAPDEKKDPGETDRTIKSLGAFALLSAVEIGEEQLFPLYSTGQEAERIFGIREAGERGSASRVQSAEAFAGQMLLSFLEAAILQQLKLDLKKKKTREAKRLSIRNLFVYLRGQKCSVSKQCVIPEKPSRQASVICQMFGVQVPSRIPTEDLSR